MKKLILTAMTLISIISSFAFADLRSGESPKEPPQLSASSKQASPSSANEMKSPTNEKKNIKRQMKHENHIKKTITKDSKK